MFKFIFYTILVIACAYFFADVFIESGTMLAEALSGVNVAFSVILSIIIVPFTTMLDFYYIKLALYIGLLIFSLSYVMKWLTGHHLTTEEDIENEKTPYDNLKVNDWEKLKQKSFKIKNKDTIKLAQDNSWLNESKNERSKKA